MEKFGSHGCSIWTFFLHISNFLIFQSGNAVGDAYGLATEFMTPRQAKDLYGNGPIAFGADPG